MPIRRADYVAALRRERASIAARPEPDERRLASIDAELDKYAPEPKVAVVETAVPNPATPGQSAEPAVQGPVEPGPGPKRGGRRAGQGA